MCCNIGACQSVSVSYNIFLNLLIIYTQSVKIILIAIGDILFNLAKFLLVKVIYTLSAYWWFRKMCVNVKKIGLTTPINILCVIFPKKEVNWTLRAPLLNWTLSLYLQTNAACTQCNLYTWICLINLNTCHSSFDYHFFPVNQIFEFGNRKKAQGKSGE